MTEFRLKLNRFFEGIPDGVTRHRWKTWIIFLLLTVFMVMGMGKFKLEMSMVSFFRDKEPVKLAYDRFRAIFGGDEMVYIVYKAKDGDVFSTESLTAVKGIQEELLNYRLKLKEGEESVFNHITDVKTIINASFLEAREDSLISREFIGKNIPKTQQEVKALKLQAANQPDYPRLYFSDDFRYGGIMVKTDFNSIPVDAPDEEEAFSGEALDEEPEMEEPDLAMEEQELPDIYSDEYLPVFKKTRIKEYVPFVKEISSILNKPEYSDHLEYHAVGNPPLMAYAFKNMTSEMGMIMVGSLLLIIIVLWILFRSFSAVVWPVLIIILSLIWVMGVIGWSGLAMTEMYNIIVFLILAVGVADSIHILSGYLYFRNQKFDHQTAIRAVYRKSGLACFLTSLTTAAGLLSMVFVPIVPLQRFAVFSAVGVMIAFMLSVFMLPLMLDIWGPVSRKKAGRIAKEEDGNHFIQSFIRRFEKISFAFPGRIILIFGICSVVLVAGSLKVRVESNSIENIKDGVPIKNSYKLVDEYLGGTGNLEVLIDSGVVNGFKDPALLKAVDSLQSHVESFYPGVVVKTISLANVTKDSFKALNEGDPDKYLIPDDAQVLAQTLFLFESANPKDRRQLVSDDYRMVRVGINSVNLGSIKALELMKTIDTYIDQDFSPLKERYPKLKVTTTGQMPLQSKLMDYISWSQIQSFAIALVTISIILLILLGSVKIGIIAIIPNLFPIITAFGVMGYFDMALDVHTLLVVPIIIGIAVDDTIHFLTHFRLEMELGSDVKTAIIHAYREAGQAIVFTSLVLAIGFLVFLFSSAKGFSYFGILSATSIVAATISDLVLLPALLYITNRKQEQK
jgi:uncharacterized protein